MEKTEIEKIYIKKINELKKHDKAYFKYDNPVISDKDSLTLKKGESQNILLNIDYFSDIDKINFNSAHTASTATSSSDIQISHIMDNSNEILVTVTANPIALSGDYKLLLGVYNSEVNVSKYIDVTIEP